MNLTHLGLSGINAAQNRLQTAGHNLNNADIVGYNRQTVLAQTAGATGTHAGYIGRGVQAVTVQRAYDGFLYRQLVSAQTTGAALVSYGNEIIKVNNLFADRTVGITPALQNFFDSMQAAASAPADPAARQELLGRASSLVGQINGANAFLNSQRENINTQIETTVTTVNSYVERVHDLNRQIQVARATNPAHEPNDLLDQRDQWVSELSQLVDVKVTEQGGKISLAVGNGQVLLGGDTVFPLHTQPSAADPSRVVIAYSAITQGGALAQVEMREDAIKGGKLGGLMSYRRDALDSVQNELGRLAAGLAIAVNEIHRTGADLNGVAGGDVFSLGPIKVLSGVRNSGSGGITADFSNANNLTGLDYRVDYDGSKYTVTSMPNGKTVDMPADGIVDGVKFNTQAGTPAAGDSWTVQPTRTAAESLTLVISDPSTLALASPGTGTANGDIGLKLAQLQDDKILGNGSMSLNESFSKIVNKVGVLAQHNGTAAKAQAALIQQNFAAQQALSGVNPDEEYVNMDRYQQQFRAASRLIEISSTLFDTLLGMRS